MQLVVGIILIVVLTARASNVNNQLHCSSKGPTCSHQLIYMNASKEDCSIRRINTSSAECKKMQLQMNSNKDLGQVALHHYLFVLDNATYFTTGLNSTFSYIKWTRLRMQYKDRANETFNFCREINLKPRVKLPDKFTLFYDCLWAIDHEDREFDFKFEIYNSRTKAIAGRHYIFKVPRHYNMFFHKPIKTWPIFMYIDITELPMLILHWETLKKILEFNVAVYVNGQAVKEKRIVGISDKNGQFSYSYDVGLNSGSIYFTLEAIHKECGGKCNKFKSPVINIQNISNRPLLIGIVGSVVLLPVFLYSLYIWKRYSLLAIDYVPVVLLVYKRSLASHTRAIISFTKYLREYCHINALLDELDIPLTNSKDPHEWYQESFSRANVVVVITSPPSSNALEAGIYQKVDILALRILSEKFSDPNCKQRFFSFMFPYCSHEDIPTEAKNFRRYSFKKDLNELLWQIRFGLKCYCVSKLDYVCYRSQIPGGDSDLQCHGKFLLDALQAAEDDVKRRALLSRKITEDNFEQIPLQEVVVSESADNSEASESLLCLKSNLPDIDDQCYYSDFPGDIQNLDLLGRGDKPSSSKESPCEVDLHQLDLNKLVL